MTESFACPACSKHKLQSEADALSPEVGALEERRRPALARGRGHQSGVWDLADVDHPVDLVPGSNDVAPIKERIADQQLNMRRDAETENQIGFWNDGEAVAVKAAAVAAQSQQTAVE